MQSIRELLEQMGQTQVHTVGPDDSVFEAVTRMVEMNVGAVLVIDNSIIKGIITERDYLRFITQKDKSAKETRVRDLMTAKVIYVTPESSLDEVMAIMTEARIRHIPILSEGRLMGIVSIGDLVKQISSDQKIHIRTLEEYINGSYPGPNPTKSEQAGA